MNLYKNKIIKIPSIIFATAKKRTGFFYEIKIIFKLVATALVMAFTFSVVSFAGACEDIESRVLRLHILANSDSEFDQH